MDLAAVPGRARAARDHHRRGLDDRSRRSTRASATWRSSGRCSSTALFYGTPVLYPIEVGARHAARHHPAEPADADVRAGAPVDDRPRGPDARRGSRRVRAPDRADRPLRGDLRPRGAGSSTARRRGSRRSSDVRAGQERAGEHDGDERQRRHLPVPVDRAVERPRGQGGGGARGQGRVDAMRGPRTQSDARQQRGEQRDAHEPELGERLELERMGVAHRLVDVAAAQPLDAKAAGAHAGQRMVGPRVDRHSPVGVAVGAQGAEALVSGAGGRRRLLMPTRGDDGDHQQGGDRREGRPARPRRQGQRAIGERRAGGERRGGHQDDRDREHDRALALARGQRTGAGAHRRGEPCGERACGPGADHERAGAQLARPLAQRSEDDEREQARGQRGQRAAREAQVAAHAQRHGRGAGRGAQGSGACPIARDARAQHDPDRRQGPYRVPVGQGLIEASGGAHLRMLGDETGEQPAAEPVADDDDRAGGGQRLERARRRSGAKGDRRGGQRHRIEQRALGVVAREVTYRRPGHRQPDPRRVGRRGHEGHTGGRMARDQLARRRGRHEHGEDGARDQQRHVARAVEEAAREEGEHHRPGDQHRTRAEQAGRAHGPDANAASRRRARRRRASRPPRCNRCNRRSPRTRCRPRRPSSRRCRSPRGSRRSRRWRCCPRLPRSAPCRRSPPPRRWPRCPPKRRRRRWPRSQRTRPRRRWPRCPRSKRLPRRRSSPCRPWRAA